jgi:two-component system CAI-1 autoinducer sensor kinase/phosphatase CqsS
MLFMNDASAVWGMSSMAAILLLFLVLDDWVAINLIYLLGNLMAWYAYSEVTGVMALPEAYFEQLPIYLFSLIAGSIFSHRNELLKQERLFVMSAIGSNIAHELRTPLQGIQSGLAGLKRYLPALIDGYRAAKENRLQVPRIRSAHLAALDELITRIENEIEYSHGFIGMLLMNSGKLQIDTSQFGWVSVRHCIEAAIERYPFSSAEDRKKVMLDPNGNFSFYGSDVLFSHVLFNLIKNALWYIHKAGKGDIRIKIVPGGERDLVVFRDGGAGIHPMVLPNIFDQFYSTQDSAKGAGIGLSFCKLAMESFGGTIKAASEYGSYAEFTMSFSRKIHVQE